MRGKSTHRENDVLETPSMPLRSFGTGEAADILGISVRRLQGYVESPKYHLNASEQLGTGRGSRRVFYEEDIYRIGVAEFLVRNGFSYKFVSKAVQQLDDNDLLGPLDDEGKERDLIYILVGGEDDVIVRGSGRDHTYRHISKAVKRGSFYVLDVSAVTGAIHKRMRGK